jgi:spermidine/putrescine transport system ATP-binding protein
MTVFQPNDGTAGVAPARGDTVWLSWATAHSYPLGTAPTAPAPATAGRVTPESGSLTPS